MSTVTDEAQQILDFAYAAPAARVDEALARFDALDASQDPDDPDAATLMGVGESLEMLKSSLAVLPGEDDTP